MPTWAISAVKWLGERALHVIIYGAIILGVGFLLYSAFLKPTSNNSNKNTGDVNYYWQNAKVSPGFGGCVTIKAEKPREIK